MSVFDQGYVDETLYLVMEYLPGMTLRDLLNDFGTLTPEQSLDITKAVLQGLAVAHREGILHRDVKPENVILVDDGRIKIGDFGLARPVNNATDTGKSLLGTVAYIAPELLTRTSADSRSDLYSVGIMLYEMLTGTQPFVGETPMQVAVQHAQQSMPFASASNPTVSRAVDDVIQWATQKNPSDRPKDARTMLDALTNAFTNGDSETNAPTRVIDAALAAASIEDSRETQRDIPTVPSMVRNEPVASVPSQQPAPRGRGVRRWVSIVLALALLGGGGGSAWWFLAGPGSLTASATVAGMAPDQAAIALTNAGFVVVEPASEEYDTDIPEGMVITTSPEITAGMPKGTEVHLVISLGPEPISFPEFEGISTADFSAQLAKLGIGVVETLAEFHPSIDSGTVISVSRPDGAAIAIGDTVYAGESVVVTESAGAIPNVKGMTVEQATTALEGVDLAVNSKGTEEYSTTIPAGRVISVASARGTIRPGDSVSLVVSKGPELIAIPDVTDMTIAAARDALEELGFDVTVDTDIPERLWGQSWAKAGSTDPSPGTEAPKGSTVTLRGAL
jgi:serine/threonine-protein kinase